MRIILVGWGVVGQSFAQTITQRKSELARKYGFRPRIVAIVDKKGAAINPKGLDLEGSQKRERDSVGKQPTWTPRNVSARSHRVF